MVNITGRLIRLSHPRYLILVALLSDALSKHKLMAICE